MRILLPLIILLSASSYAADLSQVKASHNEMGQMLSEELILNSKNADKVLDLLKEAKKILEEAQGATQICASFEGSAEYNKAKNTIDALVANHMDLGRWATKRFIKNWLKTYSCKTADAYVKQFKYVRDFAFNYRGLNLLDEEKAGKYAAEMVGNICVKANLYDIYAEALTHAESLGLENPRAIAQEKTEQEGFKCRLGVESTQVDF